LPPIARYRIASISKPIEDIVVYRMEPVEGRVPDFTPGQAVFLHLLDDKGNSVEKRPYSVASSPGLRYLEFCIKMVHGRLTGQLEKMSVGAVVGIEGPVGHFTYNGERNAAFIAGGTGVAPFLSMLRYIAENNIEGHFVLFYSVKTRAGLVYGEELAELARRNPSIEVVITLTKEEPSDWAGECGRISYEMMKKHIGSPGDYDWWVCGPPEMVKSMRVCIAGMGSDIRRLHLEAWG
jgi:Na+-transporting NADH:ubiquinone oxidoreductase subunit F